MATFIVLAKIYFIEYFCNTKVPGLGEIFVQWKFSTIYGMIEIKPSSAAIDYTVTIEYDVHSCVISYQITGWKTNIMYA